MTEPARRSPHHVAFANPPELELVLAALRDCAGELDRHAAHAPSVAVALDLRSAARSVRLAAERAAQVQP